MVFIRAYDAPSIRQLSERTGTATGSGPGFDLYTQNCSSCHGPNRAGIKLPKDIGMEAFSRVVRGGREQMPAFPQSTISARNLEILAAYLNDPAAGGPSRGAGRGGRAELVPGPARPEGIRNFNGPFGAQWLSTGGLPAIGPPWSELVAYDLNEGIIKWRVPVGTIPSLAEKGIINTGSYRPRTGPVVTAGGLIFLASGGDQTLHAYDKDNGKTLWEKRLEADPDGIPAVYELGGRQYVVFYLAGGGGGGSRTPAMYKPGKPEAQGYYAFALPQRAARTKAAAKR
jgi:quinoprotein glucose dehydrogenase